MTQGVRPGRPRLWRWSPAQNDRNARKPAGDLSYYGDLARDGREHAIKLLDALNAAEFDSMALFNAESLPNRALGFGLNPLEHAGNGSLGRVFDHVGIAVSDIAASERFYRTVLSILGTEPSHADAKLVEWDDWDIGPTDREHPETRGLHVGFRARDRAQVDAFWQAGVDAGYRDNGAPGPRTQYGPTYYGGFLLDPDGNSVEAVHGDREDAVPDGRIDHLWLRVRDLQASRRFYTTIAPHAGLRVAHNEPGRVQLSGPDYSFSLVRDERPLTEHVHLAFPAREDAAVRAFHAAALAAGYDDHGAPGERTIYHPGYYGAFVLDPDGHNVEVVNHNLG